MTTIKEINKIAKTVKDNVEKKQKLPTIAGYNYAEYGYLLAKSVISPGKDITKIKVKTAPNPTGTNISRSIDKPDYIKLAKNFVNFVNNNKQAPNFSYFGSYKIRPKLLIYSFAKIVVYYEQHKALPNYCNFNSKIFVKEQPVSNDEIFNYFVKTFGNVKTIDEAFNKIKERGYAYYYDDIYNNKNSIDRIKANRGVNCTDSCQVFWHIGKALGYEVRCIHVKCQGGDGHVRLQFKHKTNTGGKWVNRDPAAILAVNGQPLTYIWCGNGTQLAINPNWFLANVNR